MRRDLMYIMRVLKALIRGTLYVLYYRLIGRNVKITFPFKAFTKVKIIGPGYVSIGGNCSVLENVFNGLTIVTLSSDAKVKIGSNCCLGGLTIRCSKKVEIGDETMTAVSLLQDTLIVNSNKEGPVLDPFEILVAKPITIGENVWIGGQCCVLGGCNVRLNCVLATGTVCYDTSFKDYNLISGAPAKRSLPIPNILKFKGQS